MMIRTANKQKLKGMLPNNVAPDGATGFTGCHLLSVKIIFSLSIDLLLKKLWVEK